MITKPPPTTAPPPHAPFGSVVLYPTIYPWYVLLATMDLMLTWLILHFDGYEVNPIAHWVIVNYDWYGLIAYKFSLVIFVIVVCEIVGRVRDRGARRLAEWAVAVTAIPVVIAFILLFFKLYVESAAWDAGPVAP